MKPIERVYEWLKIKSPAELASLRKDIDNALVVIVQAFKDKSITREMVEIILSEKSDAEKQRALLNSRISEIDNEIHALNTERDGLTRKRDYFNIVLKQDDAKVDMSAVFAKQQEHREAEARQRLAILRAMNDQQKALAETINVSVDEIKDALETKETTQKPKKKALRG